MRRFLLASAIAVAASIGQAQALLIVPTFNLNPASDPHSFNNAQNSAAEIAAINTAIGTIDSLFTNSGTVQVLFDFDSGTFGESQNGGEFVSYSQYTARLATDAAAHPGNAILATAVANLSHGNTGNWVLGTSAFLRVGLGFSGIGTTPCYNASGTYVSGCNAVYDAIVSIGNLNVTPGGAGQNSQATAVVEHELNEVLGGGGTGTTLGQDSSGFPSGVVLGSTDLYRYRSATSTCAGITGTPSHTTNSAEVACYSIDGGKTWLVQMNQAGGGSDYGDFATTSPNIPYIQDAFYGGTTPVYSLASPETAMLESIGWNVPEPSAFALFAGAAAGLGWLRRRRLPPT